MKNKFLKAALVSVLPLSTVSLTSIVLASCGGENITIDETAKQQTVDSTGCATYTFTLSEAASSTSEFSTPEISNVSASGVTLKGTIASVSGKTLTVKVSSTVNAINTTTNVTFSMKISKSNGSWSKTIDNFTLKNVSISKYAVTMNAGEHGYFDDESTTTKTLSKKYQKVSKSDLTEPTASSSTYEFSGWYKTSACVDEFDFNKVLTSDTTIYAGWTETMPHTDPKIDYDEDKFDVDWNETTKIVTISPKSTITEATITLEGTWEDYQFNFIPTTDDTQEIEIVLNGFVLIGKTTKCPFNIQKANDGEENEMSFASVDISCKKSTSNYIYDARAYGATDTDGLKGAINAKCDLKIKSKGSLKINDSSAYKGFSQGIHCTKDLTIQKCTLNVSGYSTAIKGNKSIYVGDEDNEDPTTVTATSATGDAFKTEDTDVSSSGKRRGDITVYGDSTAITVNSTKDAFQAAHNLYIGTDKSGATKTSPTITIKTGTFNTSWSEEVVTDSQDLYFRVAYSGKETFCNPSNYTFGVYFTNESSATNGEETEATIKKITAGSDAGGGQKTTYAYWNCNRPFGYSKAFIKMYDSNGNLKATSNSISVEKSSTMSNDLLTLSTLTTSSIKAGSINANYKEAVTGGSSTRAGKTDYSSKGMKAANLFIAGGTITASVCDDFIHTKYGQLFPASEEQPSTYPAEVGEGNVTITGGTITLNDCPDDGIHADGTLTIGTSGSTTDDLTISLTPDRKYTENYCCFEGMEAGIINIYSGTTKIFVKNDGVNAAECGNTLQSNVNINVTGGLLDITAEGTDVDGIDSNNTYTQSGGVVISRGHSGTAFDIGDKATATMTGGTLICIGKMEKTPSTSLTKTTGLSYSFTAGSTQTMKFTDATTISIYFKYNYGNSNSELGSDMSTTVYSAHGTASWQS